MRIRTTDQGSGTYEKIFTINIINLNDAPTISAPVSFNVTEDIAAALTGISFADTDAGSNQVTVTLSVPPNNGILLALSNERVTANGSGTKTLTLVGSNWDINSFFASGYVTFTTALHSTTNVILTILIDSIGKTNSANITLTVTPVNDAPMMAIPDSIPVIWDVATALTGISFVDVDAGSNPVTVTLSVPSGTLSAMSGDGVTVGGTPTALTLTGTIANINAFIAGNKVKFTTASFSTDDVTLGISIDDNSYSGDGGNLTTTASITLTVRIVPMINSAIYNAGSGILVVSGIGMTTGGTIDVSKLTVTGEGGTTYTLTSDDVSPDSLTEFSINLNTADKAYLNQILNKNGTSSTGGTTYTLSADDDWYSTVSDGDTSDFGNTITVANVAVPRITSATYDARTGALVVTGTGFLRLAGAANDIVANKFTFTGDNGATYTLTDTPNVDISSGSTFTLYLSTTDKAAVNAILNKNGTSSQGGTTYNLAAAEDWAAGADPSVVVADPSSNNISVSGVNTAPTVTAPAPITYIDTVGNDSFGNSIGTLYVNSSTGNYAFAPQSTAINALSTNQSETFTVTATDNEGATGNATLTVNITGVNDTPMLKKNQGLNVAEGSLNTVITQAELEVTDAESSAASITYTLTVVPTYGSLKKGETLLHTNDTFTQDEINNNRITYTHDGSEMRSDGFSFTVSDGAGGSIGETHFPITATNVNDAPVLDGTGTIVLPSITEDDTDPERQIISDIIGDRITDSDPDAVEGIAVINVTGNGTWQYDTGSGWTAISDVSVSSALLLSDAAYLRFVPDLLYNKAQYASISFLAWDRTSGLEGQKADVSISGGSTAFSTVYAAAIIPVTGVNDVPAITGLPTVITVTESTACYVDLSAAAFSDPDSGTNDITLTLSVSSGTLSAADTGDVTAAGLGTGTLILTGTAADIDTYLNTASNITYTGAAGIFGDHAATLTLTANDGGHTGVGGGVDVPLGTVSINITAIAPTVTNVTSTKDDGTYGIGETIEIKVRFSHSVVVDTTGGVPQLVLVTVAGDRSADYTGGSGSDTLTFTYTTQAGDETSDLDYKSASALHLNGGRITRGTTDAILTLPAPAAENSLGYNKAIVIAAFPTVSLSVSPASIEEAGGTSTITATLSEISSQDVVVSLSYLGSAINGTDYNATASTSITIPAGSLSANAATGITAIDDDVTEGDETINIEIIGVSKGTSDGVGRTITILDDDTPTVSNVTSSSDNGSYKAGDTITITVTFSAPVTVTGTPQLLLATGTTGRLINYDSGSGSSFLLFIYTVQAGDNSTDLDYMDTASLTLNGSTIGSSGLAADLTLPIPGTAGSLGANKAIVIDTTPPTVTITLSDTALKIGDTSTVIITFSEPVTGFENDDLNVSNGTLTAVFSSDDVTWTATFTPAANVTDSNNIITLNNAGVTDRVGNAGIGTTDSDNYAIDTKSPTAVIDVSDTALKVGETALVTIIFSEAVTGFTNADLTVPNGTLSGIVTLDNITWTTTFTLTANVEDATNIITLDNTGIQDAAGNNGTGTTDSNNFAIDTLRPTATIVVSDTALKAGETALVTITFSEAVTGFTNNDLVVPNGTLSAVVSSDEGTTWTATFTSTANVEDATNIITLDNTGIQDAAGNIGTGTTDSNNFAIDTLRPTAIIVVSDTALKAGETALVTITFSEAVTGFENDDLNVPNGTLTAVSSSDGGTIWTAMLTPMVNVTDPTNVITLDNTGIQDAAGNTGIGTTDSNNYAIDTLVPTVTSVTVPDDGKYKAGDTLSFTVNFIEAVTVTGTPTLAITLDDGGTVNAAYVSGDNTSALVFAYTIVDGNNDTNGMSLGATLNGTIKDAAGNNASLTLNGVGSTSGVLVDTTAPTAGSAGTIGISEITYNSAKLTWTAAADLVTSAENLQYKVLFSTSNNITTLSDAETNGTAFGGWTTNITTATVTGLTASTDYYFNVLVKDEAGNKALYSSIGTTTAALVYDLPSPSTSPQSAVVEVNGEKQDAGQSTTETTGGMTTTTITVDDTKLNKILEEKGNNATVTLPASGTPDVVVGQLTGQTVKNMETKEAILEIKTETATYTLPASQINIDNVSAQFGSQVELKDIKVNVKIAEPPADTVKVVEDTANKGNYQIVVKPVEFEITCTSGDQTVEVSCFNGYVERTIAIPDGVDPSKITTGVVLNADGTFSHVPTQIVMINGKYFAKINSLTNSTYSVIYNPVTFTDVENHWAKDAVNDMGSRMVVTGIGNGIYVPERSITRAEFAAIVVRALGLKKGMTESSFGDVTLTDWFNGYVDTARAYSLITGYSSDSFAPNDTITREQAMTILARAMKLTELSITLTDSEAAALLANYTDAGLISDYAKAGVASCIKTGVVSGATASTLSPKNSITRAEVAVMVQRLLKKSGLI